MSYGDLIDAESEQAPETVAEHLRSIAEDLEDGDEISVTAGDETVTVEAPTEPFEFEVELEREEGRDGDEVELELELEWTVEAGDEDDGIAIE